MGDFRAWFKIPTSLVFSTRFQRLTNEQAGSLFRLAGFIWKDSPDQSSILYDTEDLSNLLRVSEESVQKIVSKLTNGDDPIVVVESDRLVIPFLRDQVERIDLIRQQRRDAVNARWDAVRSGKRYGKDTACKDPVSGSYEKSVRESYGEDTDNQRGGEGSEGRRGGRDSDGESKEMVSYPEGYSSADADASLPISGIPPERKRRFPDCPVKEIVRLYDETLVPPLPPGKIGEHLRKQVRERWRSEEERQSLEWWKSYFDFVSGCPYLMGNVKNWKANLLWLSGRLNMEKVLNGLYLPNEIRDKYSEKTLRNMRVAADLIRKMRDEQETEETT